MTESVPDKPTPQSKVQFLKWLLKGLPTVIVLGILVGAWYAVHELDTSGDQTESSDDEQEIASNESTLVLPLGKMEAGEFESTPVGHEIIQYVHMVPGRIRYDEAKHIEVKCPIDGIISEVVVKPGESVSQGQLLAVINSPEIGIARSEITKRRQQLEIAQNQLDREKLLSLNLNQLFQQLDQGRSIDELEKSFSQKPLGSFREELFSAYSKYNLANKLYDNIKSLGNSGAIPGKIISERTAQRQVALATFQTIRDQAEFASSQATLKAAAELEEANRQFGVARVTLKNMLGYEELVAEEGASGELTKLEIRAAISGTVESRAFAKNERVTQGDSLFVLANTDSLYVSADIRESDWGAVELKSGAKLMVVVPAIKDGKIEAIVHYVGREVNSESNSIPLVAKIDNLEKLLRPGMFVRVEVPLGLSKKAITVKPESILQHENQEFVFVEKPNGTYQRVNVTTGLASEKWVEVTNGLETGQRVVHHNAFLLKSELLLEGE